jgi:hypothetical protein
MTRIRLIMLSLLAVFAFSAVVSASASAFKKEYEVCQVGTRGVEPPEKFDNHTCSTKAKPLAEREWSWQPIAAGTKFAVESAGGEFTLETVNLTVKCTAVTDESEPLHVPTSGIGPAGESEGLKITFTGCTANAGKCDVSSSGIAGDKTVVVNDIDNQLVERKTAGGVTVLADEFIGQGEFVTLKFKKECLGFVETKVTGQVAGECKNITEGGVGKVELNFPKPELQGNSLNAFGKAAKLFGKAKVSLVNGWSSRCV